MSAGTCGACGKPLKPSRGGPPRKWCSEYCRKAQYMRPCEKCGTLMGRDGVVARRYCVSCCQDAATATIRARWSPRQQQLIALYEEGLPLVEIADRMGYKGKHKVQSVVIAMWRIRTRYGYEVAHRYNLGPDGRRVA